MVSMAYVTTLTYASTNHHWARLICPLVGLSKTKPCQFSSVQLRRSVRAISVFAGRDEYNVHSYNNYVRTWYVSKNFVINSD